MHIAYNNSKAIKKVLELNLSRTIERQKETFASLGLLNIDILLYVVILTDHFLLQNSVFFFLSREIRAHF